MGRRATNKEHKFADGCEMVSTREEFTPTLSVIVECSLKIIYSAVAQWWSGWLYEKMYLAPVW